MCMYLHSHLYPYMDAHKGFIVRLLCVRNYVISSLSSPDNIEWLVKQVACFHLKVEHLFEATVLEYVMIGYNFVVF